MDVTSIRQTNGVDADVIVSASSAGLRVKAEVDKAALAHPRWMTREELADLVEVASALLDRWPS